MCLCPFGHWLSYLLMRAAIWSHLRSLLRKISGVGKKKEKKKIVMLCTGSRWGMLEILPNILAEELSLVAILYPHPHGSRRLFISPAP